MDGLELDNQFFRGGPLGSSPQDFNRLSYDIVCFVTAASHQCQFLVSQRRNAVPSGTAIELISPIHSLAQPSDIFYQTYLDFFRDGYYNCSYPFSELHAPCDDPHDGDILHVFKAHSASLTSTFTLLHGPSLRSSKSCELCTFLRTLSGSGLALYDCPNFLANTRVLVA